MNKKVLFVLFTMITSVFSRFEIQFNDNNITIFEIVDNHCNNKKVDKYIDEYMIKHSGSLRVRDVQIARNQKLVIKLDENTVNGNLFCTYNLYNFKSTKIRIFRPNYFTIQDCFDIMKHDYFIYLSLHHSRDRCNSCVDEYIIDFINRYIYSLELDEKINKLKENNVDIEDLF